MAVMMGFPRLLSECGLDPNAFIRHHGCDPALFRNPDNLIDFSAIGRLLAQVAAESDCRYPGLEIGRQHGLDVMGAVGRIARLAPDLGTALRCIVLHMHLHDRGSVPYIWTNEEQALFGYILYCADVTGTEHIYDGALAIAYNFICELLGPDWRPTEVRFFRDRPEDTAPFSAHFRGVLRFRAQQAAVVFPAADLRRPSVNADSDRYAAALRDLETLDAAFSGGLADKVRRLLRHLMVTGAFLSVPALDRATLATLLGLHPRSLNRRLRAEGTTFAALLDECRYAIARELLRDTHLLVQDVAFLLGYAERASFDHAFRRWSGMAPKTWRALLAGA
jgi:AraC-like DNA-binding protein